MRSSFLAAATARAATVCAGDGRDGRTERKD